MTTVDSHGMTADDVAVVAELIALERSHTTADAPLFIGPYSVFLLVGALQLALRHPAMAAQQREEITAIARSLQALFTADSRPYALLELGFEPANDQPWTTR